MKIEFRPDTTPMKTRLAQGGDKLEATFLGEMLKIVMPDGSAGAFGGGAGESQFASFMTDEYANALAARLDLGLSARMERRDA